jgi:hypothetical protein
MTISEEKLRLTAFQLRSEISKLDVTDPMLKKAVDLLAPLIDFVEAGRFDRLPIDLPERRFFYGMQDDCLAAWHLDKGVLLGAIGDFGEAIRSFKHIV